MLKKIIFILATSVMASSMSLAAEKMQDSMSMNMNASDHKIMMMQDEMKSMDKKMMKDLGPKDATYDKRFMDLMIVHHEGGIMMAKDALKNSDRPEIKALAQKIIETQEKEIQQMKDWEKSWYGQ
jgi:uncharacterized protein (DUF305 family)